jgi:hypothetical protein
MAEGALSDRRTFDSLHGRRIYTMTLYSIFNSVS